MDPKKLYKNLLSLDTKLAVNIKKANAASALLVANTAKAKIQRGSRHGRFYKRRTIVHQSSAPGEYPKTDTGSLVSSINVDLGLYSAKVGSDLKYARYLEEGSIHMEARPWLSRAYSESLDRIEKFYNDAIQDALK